MFVTVLSSNAVTRIAVVVVHIIKYISLMPVLNNADALEDNVLRNFGGAVENNLNFYTFVLCRYVAARGQTYLLYR